MADIIDFKPRIEDVKDCTVSPALEVPIREKEEIQFNSQVHFDSLDGFHMKSNDGKHIYQLNGLLRNFVANVIQEMF